jgi:hypothetical protein
METSKLSRYDWVAVAGMALMFLALFLSWYRVEILQDFLGQLSKALGGQIGDTSGLSQNGWHYGSAVVAWLLTLAAAAVAFFKALPGLSFELPIPEGVTVMALGGLAFLLVVFRLIVEPSPAGAYSRGGGILVGLLATALVAFAGFLKNAETP